METIRVTTVKMKGGHIGGTDVKLFKGTRYGNHSRAQLWKILKGHGSENYGGNDS